MTSRKARYIARAFRIAVGVPIIGVMVSHFVWELYMMDPDERSELFEELLHTFKGE
jgi:hypothetical protein